MDLRHNLTSTESGDHLLLSDYRRAANIGAFEEERAQSQNLIFNIDVTLRQPFDTKSDHVDDVLSYDELIYAIDDCLSHRRYNLLEALGEDICARITALPNVANIKLRIEKPDRTAGLLGIKMHRHATNKAKPNVGFVMPAVEIWLCAPPDEISARFEAAVQNQSNAPIICPSLPGADYKGQYGERRLLYALSQTACELAQIWPHLRLSRTMAELRHAQQQKQGQIWVPVDLVLAAAQPPAVTTDASALAHWLATQLECAKFVNTRKIYGD